LSRPALHFVFVGPEQTDPAAIKSLPNVHFLGPKPHGDLPSYISGFDAALIPYLLTEYTASVYPTKLNEYSAMGIPVISTALPEVVQYGKENGNIIFVADDAESFVELLDKALTESHLGREARIEAARQNGWDERVQKMSALILDALDQRRQEPIIMSGVFPRLVQEWRSPAITVAWIFAILSICLRWSPLPWMLASPLLASSPPEVADAAVVLGGGAGESGEIGQGHQERIERAIELRQLGFVPRIVICSGKVQAYSESEVMRAIALAKGVPDRDILIESNANGTKQMLSAAIRLSREKGWRKVLLVSSPYHMRRSMMVWARLAPDIGALPTPVKRSRFYSYYGFQRSSFRGATLRQTWGLLQEYGTLIYYRFKGWL
jgi:uncharacterized SAM-binding protein YcdF (DUF218 family)